MTCPARSPGTMTYPAWILRVVDGDTVVARIDLGLNVQVLKIVRLAGIDCPDAGSLAGRLAADFTRRQLLHRTVDLEIGRRTFDKYGRVLAVVFLDGNSFNQRLLAEGYARPYPDQNQEDAA